MRFFCTFGLNFRFVRGALRTHLLPRDCNRILRPKVVRLSQMSHLPEALGRFLRLWDLRL